MDGFSPTPRSRIVILGATNRPNALDPALRRPGRFDREVEIGVPNSSARTDILATLLRDIPHRLSSEDIAKVASTAHGYVGADLAAVCREAGLKTIRRWASGEGGQGEMRIELEDVKRAMAEVRPSAMREVSRVREGL